MLLICQRNLSFQYNDALRPQLYNLKGRLKKSEGLKLMKLHENDVYIWDDGMALVPKSGTAYIIKGHIDSINNILKADGICWNNKSRGQTKENPKHYFYYVAIPIFGKTKEKPGRDPALNVSFRKLIMYDKKSSTFLVEYVGNDSQYEWKRKHLKTNDVSGIQEKSTYYVQFH